MLRWPTGWAGTGFAAVADGELVRVIAEHRGAGRRIVFTNGCFDVLHRGHVASLNQAKQLGDVLIVAVNDDASMRRRKGEARPVNPVPDRVAVLAALSCVDHVVVFTEDTPARLIRLPGTLARLHAAITELGCGFVGAAVQGLSYLADRRPRELEPYEERRGRPVPELVEPGAPGWQRWTCTTRPTPTHLAERIPPGQWRAYKVAWVGGCVHYDRHAPTAAGGFDSGRSCPSSTAVRMCSPSSG
ncbi:MAG: adenylyltransferase/cytidyltransferase family protein [Pseudonocardiaceae bacterium]